MIYLSKHFVWLSAKYCYLNLFLFMAVDTSKSILFLQVRTINLQHLINKMTFKIYTVRYNLRHQSLLCFQKLAHISYFLYTRYIHGVILHFKLYISEYSNLVSDVFIIVPILFYLLLLVPIDAIYLNTQMNLT